MSYCKYHLRWVHEGGWCVRPGPDGTFALLDTDGEAYPAQLPWTGKSELLTETPDHAGIDSDTCIPMIDGNPVDYDYVVDVLMLSG